MQFSLTCTRFNATTRIENSSYRREKDYDGCIYGTPVQISSKIPHNHNLFVFEMDVSPHVKKIIGIGFIKNVLDRKTKCSIYNIPKFNRYIYFSNYRIDVKDMTTNELEFIEKIQYSLFKTKSHVQRSIGITQIPIKNLNNVSLTENYVATRALQMFKDRMVESRFPPP